MQPSNPVRKWLPDQLQQGRHTVTTNRIRGNVYVTKIVFDQSTKEILCYKLIKIVLCIIIMIDKSYFSSREHVHLS